MEAYSPARGFLAVCSAYANATYRWMVVHACTVIMFAALLGNLAVKLFHAGRSGLLSEYPTWILTDLGVLLTIEAALALVCYRRPTVRIVRATMVVAAILCTWSGMNAGWLIRTGTQILPMELLPLIRDPINITKMVFRNFLAMPGAAAVVLIPGAIALAFFFSALARPMIPSYNPRQFRIRIAICLGISLFATLANMAVSNLGSAQVAAAGMRYNCQARAVLAFFLPRYRHLARDDFRYAVRDLPRHDAVPVALKPHHANHNVVIVVLEGVQYDCTSLAVRQGGVAPRMGPNGCGLTPHIASLAAQGATFTNARSVLTHTTKALFALMTGRFPSASQDTSEALPMEQPYASLATILEKGLGFRTAFFQSPTGTFESRPGLVYNLGFDKFFCREDLHDPNQFVGYLGADEFALLDPIRQWVQSENTPFLAVVMCSVTHDPYEVPSWFEEKAREPVDRYMQTIRYTDRFVAALDAQLTEMNLQDHTILCVVGDHGEAFSEHRSLMGHERIAYDEVLRIAMCMRAPGLIDPGKRINAPVSSVDLAPTILGLLGFDIEPMSFDGFDAMKPMPADRKVYLAGWMQQGPAGFIQGDRKVVYSPEDDRVEVFHLNADPLELNGAELGEPEAGRLAKQITDWRRNTIFKIDEDAKGQTTLFGSWQSKWTGRESRVKYIGTP